MTSLTFTPDVTYRNLLDGCRFEDSKPVIEGVTEVPKAQVKRVAPKAGTELNCHKTADHVLVVWLRGKARFTANDEAYTMHPGSIGDASRHSAWRCS